MTSGRARLGHRRLSIVDVQGGDQPLHGEGHHLVANGEIYNHEALRHALRGPFATRSDNEVILRLVVERGPDAIGDLRGMYAFCLSSPDGGFVAARDPIGIKPLYWARRGGVVRFASEIGAFDAGWLPEVEAFPPGHVWDPVGGLRRFAAVDERHEGPPAVPAGGAESDWAAALRAALSVAVERRMMADVPLGVFLSGGLDSSIVAALAVQHRAGGRLPTFAVGVEGSPDLDAARVVAEHLGTDHHERVYTAEEAVAALPRVIEAIESYEPSLVRSAVPNLFLAELAARRCKVVLTGEGADELLAGYAYLRDIGEAELHRELVRTVEGLHNLNLQRCDRVTMAHGLEARVPFLDLDVIALALDIPAASKAADGSRMEKHLLRVAFADVLPEEIVWRRKVQFGDGSGARDVLAAHAERQVSDEELAAAQAGAAPPRSKEELLYQRLFRRRFPGVRETRVLGRFATA